MFLNPSNSVAVFWRARCKRTGREMKFRTRMGDLPTADAMAKWVADFFRDLEYLDHCPWESAENVGRVSYPVPVHHVRLDVKMPDMRAPDRTRTTAYVTRAPIARKPIAKAPIVVATRVP